MIPRRQPPDIKKIKRIINEWVTYYPCITKVYLFGSYVKKNKSVISDIDIAVEISQKDDDATVFWCREGNRMEKQLSHFLDYKVQLELLDENEKPTIIEKGLDEGNILIYKRKNV